MDKVTTREPIEFYIEERIPDKPGLWRITGNRGTWDIWQELRQRLDVAWCDDCNRAIEEWGEYEFDKHYHQPCPHCGKTENGGFFDEYGSGPDQNETPDKERNGHYRWVSVWPVEGANEGHYIHLDLITQGAGRNEYWRLGLIKTWRGLGGACRMVEYILAQFYR